MTLSIEAPLAVRAGAGLGGAAGGDAIDVGAIAAAAVRALGDVERDAGGRTLELVGEAAIGVADRRSSGRSNVSASRARSWARKRGPLVVGFMPGQAHGASRGRGQG